MDSFVLLDAFRIGNKVKKREDDGSIGVEGRLLCGRRGSVDKELRVVAATGARP